MAGFYGRTGIEFKGNLATNLENLSKSIRSLAMEAVLEGGEIIRAAAYNNANVSPGVRGHGRDGEHMRDELKVTAIEYPAGVSARIGIDMAVIPYAAHQEFGPRGNAFLARAIDETRGDVRETMGAIIKAGLGADGKVAIKVRFRKYA